MGRGYRLPRGALIATMAYEVEKDATGRENPADQTNESALDELARYFAEWLAAQDFERILANEERKVTPCLPRRKRQ